MYTNDYMYAIERSDDYLAHYGIKGMKWGVRKAIASGNERAMARAYKKAQKKLAKLTKRAANGKKYARNAALLGAGAAAAGGLAVAGTQGVGRAVNTVGSKGGSLMRRIGTSMGAATPGVAAALSRRGFKKTAAAVNTVGSKVGGGLRRAGTTIGAGAPGAGAAISRWGQSNSISGSVGRSVENAIARRGIKGGNLAVTTAKGMKANKAISGVSNNTIARIGAGAIGAGLAAGAGYNAYRAATTKRAARKADEWRREMNKAFAGTKYANGGSARQGNKRKRNKRG